MTHIKANLADRLTVIGAAPDETLVEGCIVDILTGTRKSARYSLIRQGRFPAPVKVTAHASRWRLGDLRAWLSDPAGWLPGAAGGDAAREEILRQRKVIEFWVAEVKRLGGTLEDDGK